MTEIQAKEIFEKYNPAGDVIRCPNGRAKMRKPLDLYARAAVNLYGIIRREEFVEIFNSQNDDKTTADEVYTILLPNVRKFGWYGFYKDYIVHYVALHNFDWVRNLEQEQAGKPRFIPPKEQFLQYEWEEHDDFDYWQEARMYMLETFGFDENIMDGFEEIKVYLKYSVGVKELGTLMKKYKIVPDGQKQAQKFFDVLMFAANNTRKWQNKGYTPNEMMKFRAEQQPTEPFINQHIKIRPNERCPCGSGKKYKMCCARIESSGLAQLSPYERKIFYETWYKLLDFINQKHSIVNIRIKPVYPAFHDELQLLKIREKLWANPRIIGEFISSTDKLSDEEISLLQSWEKNHIKGQFLLVKYESEYAIIMRTDKDEPSKLYAVKGMTTSIAEAMHRQLPVMLDTVLLPFKDKIIYDSFMASHNISFGDGIKEMFEKEYVESKDMYGIIRKL